MIGSLAAFAALGVGALIYVGPWEARESDQTYVALAASTSQGRVYFTRFPDVRCNVSRGREVTVNCDTVEVEGSVRYPQIFRVFIDARSNSVSRVEIQTTAK
jgi:hypothetical protein